MSFSFIEVNLSIVSTISSYTFGLFSRFPFPFPILRIFFVSHTYPYKKFASRVLKSFIGTPSIHFSHISSWPQRLLQSFFYSVSLRPFLSVVFSGSIDGKDPSLIPPLTRIIPTWGDEGCDCLLEKGPWKGDPFGFGPTRTFVSKKDPDLPVPLSRDGTLRNPRTRLEVGLSSVGHHFCFDLLRPQTFCWRDTQSWSPLTSSDEDYYRKSLLRQGLVILERQLSMSILITYWLKKVLTPFILW